MGGFLASDRATRVAWALGLLLVLPTFAVGFLHDDTGHRLILEGAVPELAKPAHQLYDFTPDPDTVRRFVEMGAFPWWSDPELRLRFFRPLSSWTLFVDHALFGRSTFWPHLHTLLWFALLTAAAIGVFRRLLEPRAAALASFLFCLAGAHAMPTSWIAARHAIIGAAFAVLALWMHLAFRRTGKPSRAVLASVMLLLGLASSEIAVCGLIFIVLYEALAETGPLRPRFVAALPTLVIGLAYTIFYVGSGYGVAHSGLYLSPLDDPVAFASVAVIRVADLCAELFGALPALLSQVTPETAVLFAILGVAVTGAVLGLLYSLRDHIDDDGRRRLRWLAVSSIACTVPVVGGSLGGRMLLVSLIGSAALVASAFVLARAQGGRLARGFVLALVVFHLAIGVLVRLGITIGNAAVAEAQREIATTTDPTACGDDGRLFIVTGADPTLSMFFATAVGFHRPPPPGTPPPAILSMAAHDQILEVRDDHTIELTVDDDAPRFRNPFEVIYRDAPLSAGERFEAGGLDVEVLAVEDGLWTRVRIRYEPGFSEVCMARWDGEVVVLEPFPPPGSRLEIPHVPGPMGI